LFSWFFKWGTLVPVLAVGGDDPWRLRHVALTAVSSHLQQFTNRTKKQPTRESSSIRAILRIFTTSLPLFLSLQPRLA